MDLFAWENEWQCQVEVIAACKIIIIIPILFSIIKVCIGRNYGPIILSTIIDYSGVVVVVWARGRWWYSEVNENINHHSVGLFVSCNLSIKFANIWIQWCVDALPLYVLSVALIDCVCLPRYLSVHPIVRYRCPNRTQNRRKYPKLTVAIVSVSWKVEILLYWYNYKLVDFKSICTWWIGWLWYVKRGAFHLLNGPNPLWKQIRWIMKCVKHKQVWWNKEF